MPKVASPAGIEIEVDRPPGEAALRELLSAAWGKVGSVDYADVFARSLAYLTAYDGDRLVGFVNLAWDGGIHASIFDTCVHPDWRHRGVGTALVKAAIDIAKARGARYVHVDYEPHLARFYAGCGFRPTAAGLISLNGSSS